MHPTPFHYVRWLTPQFISVLLVWSMMRSQLKGKYPVFFWYTCLQLVRFAVLFAVRDSRLAYFFAYWALEAFDVVVTLAVIHEIYAAVFSAYPGLRRAGTAMFHWAM